MEKERRLKKEKGSVCLEKGWKALCLSWLSPPCSKKAKRKERKGMIYISLPTPSGALFYYACLQYTYISPSSNLPEGGMEFGWDAGQTLERKDRKPSSDLLYALLPVCLSPSPSPYVSLSLSPLSMYYEKGIKRHLGISPLSGTGWICMKRRRHGSSWRHGMFRHGQEEAVRHALCTGGLLLLLLAWVHVVGLAAALGRGRAGRQGVGGQWKQAWQRGSSQGISKIYLFSLRAGAVSLYICLKQKQALLGCLCRESGSAPLLYQKKNRGWGLASGCMLGHGSLEHLSLSQEALPAYLPSCASEKEPL